MWAWSRGRRTKRDGNEPQRAGRRAEAHATFGVGVFGSAGFSPRGFCLGMFPLCFVVVVPGLKPRLRVGLVGAFGSVGFSPRGFCLGFGCVVFCSCVPGLKPRLRVGCVSARGIPVTWKWLFPRDCTGGLLRRPLLWGLPFCQSGYLHDSAGDSDRQFCRAVVAG